MTVHKLTAGSGYDYLTRQVAAQDATERGHSGWASYYSTKGEASEAVPDDDQRQEHRCEPPWVVVGPGRIAGSCVD